MRAVVQRVDRASVTVDEKITGEVQKGLLVLLGVAEGDAAVEVGLADGWVAADVTADSDGVGAVCVGGVDAQPATTASTPIRQTVRGRGLRAGVTPPVNPLAQRTGPTAHRVDAERSTVREITSDSGCLDAQRGAAAPRSDVISRVRRVQIR